MFTSHVSGFTLLFLPRQFMLRFCLCCAGFDCHLRRHLLDVRVLLPQTHLPQNVLDYSPHLRYYAVLLLVLSLFIP